MSKIARSAKGEIVDFDLIAIRQQLSEAPATIDVANRRQYIDNKESGKPTSDPLLRPIGVEDKAAESEFGSEI